MKTTVELLLHSLLKKSSSADFPENFLPEFTRIWAVLNATAIFLKILRLGLENLFTERWRTNFESMQLCGRDLLHVTLGLYKRCFACAFVSEMSFLGAACIHYFAVQYIFAFNRGSPSAAGIGFVWVTQCCWNLFCEANMLRNAQEMSCTPWEWKFVIALSRAWLWCGVSERAKNMKRKEVMARLLIANAVWIEMMRLPLGLCFRLALRYCMRKNS